MILSSWLKIVNFLNVLHIL